MSSVIDKLNLKKDQGISFIIYKGTNKIEANSLVDQIQAKIDANMYVPLSNTIFNLEVLEVESHEEPNIIDLDVIYTVTVKGRLI